MKKNSSKISFPTFGPTNPPAPSTSPPSPVGFHSDHRAPTEEIRHRAYARWEHEGHPADRSLANWLDAEAETLSEAR